MPPRPVYIVAPCGANCAEITGPCGSTPSCPVIDEQPDPLTVVECAESTAFITVIVVGDEGEGAPGVGYQWQVSVGGGGWTNLSNGGVYTGATSRNLGITAAPLSYHGNAYRCVLTKEGCENVISDGAALTVTECVESEPGDISEQSPYSVTLNELIVLGSGWANIRVTGTVAMEAGPWTFGPGGSGGGMIGGKDTQVKGTAITATWEGPGTTVGFGTLSGKLSGFTHWSGEANGADWAPVNLGQCATGTSPSLSGVNVTVHIQVSGAPGGGEPSTNPVGPLYGPCLLGEGGVGPCTEC